jgi:hypothetical protein
MKPPTEDKVAVAFSSETEMKVPLPYGSAGSLHNFVVQQIERQEADQVVLSQTRMATARETRETVL